MTPDTEVECREALLTWLLDGRPKDEQAEVRCALASKGDRQGLIKRAPPRSGLTGRLAWEAIMSVVAPSRVSIGALLFLREGERERFLRLERWATACAIPLNAYFQRPCEFNLWHFRHEPVPIQEAVTKLYHTRIPEEATP